MDSVNNRSLFRRKSTAARDKVRDMGMIPRDRPQGILASFTELMNVAGRDRTMGLMPTQVQQARPMQQMQMQGPMMAMPAPVAMQEGGDVALEAFRQGAPEPTLGQQFQAVQRSAMGGVDIGATPTPRERVETPDISTMVRQNLGDDPEAQREYDRLETAIVDPDVSPDEVQALATDAANVENTRENFRDLVSQITGREQPADATVDELNDAITGVALGGAIGGPRSVAERISNALLVGLQAKRETAMGREAFEQELAVAAAGGGGDGDRGPRSSTYRSPINAYQDAQDAVARLADYEIPEGMTRDEYAREVAEQRIRDSYTPDQLLGTQFEGIHSRGPSAAAPQGEASVPTLEQFMQAARSAPQNEGVSDEALIEYYNSTYGG